MEYVYALVILIALSVILAASFNFIIGYAGLVSIAHPVFYAIGAYVSAILARDHGVPVPAAMLLGALAATAASIAVALPSLRVSGDYLLIASIGFQLGLLEAIKNLSVTGGAGGLVNIPPFLIQSVGREAYVALVVGVAILTVLLIRSVAHGPYGRALSAMRDDELAFGALGRNAVAMKVAVFGLGSGLAGLAGALYAHYFRFVTPEQFELLQSAAILTMVVVGGIRTTWGPVVGAVLLQALPQAITFLNLPSAVLGPLQGLLFTGLVLVFMFWRPQGLVAARDVWRPSGMDPMPPVLEVSGLSKSFGGIVVADRIDLTLEAGRIVGLIGPNGAGKTSLFNLVSGVFPADAGSVSLDGERIDGLKLHKRARRGLSRTWQNLRLFPSLSVLDNLMVGPRRYPGELMWRLALDRSGLRAEEARTRGRALDVLERTGLAAVARTPAADLTFGQQKLVGVARALMNECRCLLLDEPMAGVEGQAYETIRRVVRDVAAGGVAVCVVEHNVAFIRDLCDEGVFMFAGKVLARKPVADLIADPRLTELYFGT